MLKHIISSISCGIITILFPFFACFPLQMIQSARATGNFGMGMNYQSKIIKSKTLPNSYGESLDAFF